jgi:RNA polymerase sigma factor (sigma-70 family)
VIEAAGDSREAGDGANRGAEEREDAALMGRVRAGDEAAFAELMTRWELPVKRLIARIVFNVSEAEELAQETLLRVWQQREKFRDGAAVRPWIFAIAANLARNRLRWWRRRPEVSLQAWSEMSGRGDRETEIGDRTGVGGAEALERAERAAAVRDAVAALPLELREALVLFEYEGLGQADIAMVLGCSVKAVESRVARAREKLRTALVRWV